MKTVSIAIVLGLSLCGCSVPQLQTASTALLAADWGQTRYIAKNDDYYEKCNWILGDDPSTSEVDLYFGSVIIGNLLVGEFVEEKYSKPYYYGIIVLEAIMVHHNLSVGVRF